MGRCRHECVCHLLHDTFFPQPSVPLFPRQVFSCMLSLFILSLECTTFRGQNHLARVTPNKTPQMGHIVAMNVCAISFTIPFSHNLRCHCCSHDKFFLSCMLSLFILSLECATFRRQNYLVRVTPNEKPQMGRCHHECVCPYMRTLMMYSLFLSQVSLVMPFKLLKPLPKEPNKMDINFIMEKYNNV